MKDIFLLLYYPFINHVLEFIFSKEWSLKWYSITKFKKTKSNQFTFLKGKKMYLCTLLKKLKIKL
jgi:hypothetical protein